MSVKHVERFSKINPLGPVAKLDNTFFKKNLSPFQFEIPTDFFLKIFQSFGKNPQRILFRKSVSVSGKFTNGFFSRNLSKFRRKSVTDFFLKIFRCFGKKTKRIFLGKSFDCFVQHPFGTPRKVNVYGRLQRVDFEYYWNWRLTPAFDFFGA